MPGSDGVGILDAIGVSDIEPTVTEGESVQSVDKVDGDLCPRSEDWAEGVDGLR